MWANKSSIVDQARQPAAVQTGQGEGDVAVASLGVDVAGRDGGDDGGEVGLLGHLHIVLLWRRDGRGMVVLISSQAMR